MAEDIFDKPAFVLFDQDKIYGRKHRLENFFQVYLNGKLPNVAKRSASIATGGAGLAASSLRSWGEHLECNTFLYYVMNLLRPGLDRLNARYGIIRPERLVPYGLTITRSSTRWSGGLFSQRLQHR
jgi:hypothetical protein